MVVYSTVLPLIQLGKPSLCLRPIDPPALCSAWRMETRSHALERSLAVACKRGGAAGETLDVVVVDVVAVVDVLDVVGIDVNGVVDVVDALGVVDGAGGIPA